MRVERTNNDFADHPPTAGVLGLGAHDRTSTGTDFSKRV